MALIEYIHMVLIPYDSSIHNFWFIGDVCWTSPKLNLQSPSCSFYLHSLCSNPQIFSHVHYCYNLLTDLPTVSNISQLFLPLIVGGYDLWTFHNHLLPRGLLQVESIGKWTLWLRMIYRKKLLGSGLRSKTLTEGKTNSLLVRWRS